MIEIGSVSVIPHLIALKGNKHPSLKELGQSLYLVFLKIHWHICYIYSKIPKKRK